MKSRSSSFTVDALDAALATCAGARSPRSPSVVSGDRPWRGRRCTNSAASFNGAHHPPFRVAGMRVESLEGDRHRIGREVLDLELAAHADHRACRRTARRSGSTSKYCVPRPTSSSGVKPILTGPCGTSGCAIRYSAAAMISATPDLSSEPSSVRPGRGDDVVAVLCGQLRVVGFAQHERRDRRAARGRARRSSCGRSAARCAPLTSGDVSTWAMKPMAGTASLPGDAGIVAIT